MTTTCPKCQNENPDNSVYCGKCGTKFDAGEKILVRTKTIEAPIGELTAGSTFADRYRINARCVEEVWEEFPQGGKT